MTLLTQRDEKRQSSLIEDPQKTIQESVRNLAILKDVFQIGQGLSNSCIDWILTQPRWQRRQLLIAFDLCTFIATIYLSLLLKFGYWVPVEWITDYKNSIIVLFSIQAVIFQLLGIYRSVWRYVDLENFQSLFLSITLSILASLGFSYCLSTWFMPRGVLLTYGLLFFSFTVCSRLYMARLLLSRKQQSEQLSQTVVERIIIYGAGEAGCQLIQSIRYNPNYKILGLVDDNLDFENYKLCGYFVHHSSYLFTHWAADEIDAVVLAMPSVSPARRRQITANLKAEGIQVKTVPSLGDILTGRVGLQMIREIDVADLLGRPEVPPNLELLKETVQGKVVLVTGAGGSIGSELCRQIAQQQPKGLILYELNEFALYTIDQELSENHPTLVLEPCLGDVTDEVRLNDLIRNHGVETIYHAAAYKHVPLVEANAAQGIRNNVLGTWVTARCAVANCVRNFILISTDKAVRPTNVMGASKRVAELLIQSLAAEQEQTTCFAIVRFGNVLGSSGSVVPKFKKQIQAGQSLTLTHREITRYFMTIPEAARLVMQAGAMAKGGEVFLLDMGEPVRIYDLAEQMIRLSGLEPGRDIDIKISGLRPGEKLYEELLISGENVSTTSHPKIYSSQEPFLELEILKYLVNKLLQEIANENSSEVRAYLKKLVPEYVWQKSRLVSDSTAGELVQVCSQ